VVRAGTLLDDHFLLGNRTTQNLTNSSAWFANGSGSSLTNLIGTNTIGALNGVVPTSSCMWMTYFMPPGNPSALNIGDTLKVTMVFTNIGVSVNGNATTGIRLGLFNYSAGGTRITADGFGTSAGNGTSVPGYATLMNFGQTFGIANPLSIRKRTLLDPNLLGSSTEYTTLGAGGGNSGDPGFTNGVQYTYEYSVTRTDVDIVVITNHIFGPNLNVEFDIADTSGAYTNFDCFAIRPANAVGCASNIVFTEFKVEGPPGLLTAPVITANPQDMTLTVSDFGVFGGAAGGSLPIGYQWYYTNNNTTTRLTGQTNQNLLLVNIQPSQAGQYFMIATNSQGSATTTVATLTVNTPVHSSRGVIVDDMFQNSSRIVSVGPSNSDWVASVDSTLPQPNIPGPLLGTTQPSTSTLWIGYFIDPYAPAPVDLAVGDALRVTLVFYPTNVAPQNTSSLRFGIFDYFDGATPLFGDGNVSSPTWNGSGGGLNVRGYMLTVNFGTQFGDNTPLAIQVRTNLSSAGLMSATGDFLSLGSGPGGMSNAPAFSEASQYTLELTAARTATTTMQVNAQITGNQLTNLSFTATDTNYFTHRFSVFGIRPNRPTDSATNLTITQFKAEVVAASILPFSITSTRFSPPQTFSLTWPSVTGKFYYVESTPALNPTAWITNATVTATGSSTSWTNTSASGPAAFYRVLAPAQP
jgi:hypothetical protein